LVILNAPERICGSFFQNSPSFETEISNETQGFKSFFTRLKGFEPSTSTLGGWHSIQTELQAHIFKWKYDLKNMLVKVLGFVDLIAGLILIFGAGIKFPYVILIILGIIFLVKSFMGGIPKDLGSITDLSIGIIFVLMIFFSVHWIICLIAGILVIQKGVFSFL
jgi:hypothetical protein